MSTPVHLAVDLGASSGRVIAGKIDSGKLTLEEVHRFANDPVRVQDSIQWNLLGLWAEILEGLRQAAKKYDSILSVGVDSWGVDFAFIDSNNQVAGPFRQYRDPRNEPMLLRAQEILGGGSDDASVKRGRDAIFEATGVQFIQINTIYQLLASVESKDRAVEIADGFVMIGDFFHWLLTGKQSVETTNGSTTQLLNPMTGDWAWDLIEKLGIPKHLFPQVTLPATELGKVQQTVRDVTGLGDVPVVVPATHDTASAVLSVPVDDFAPEKPDWCYISSGTWSLMGCELNQPLVNSLCSELNFTNEGGVAGSTRLLKNLGGLWVFQQIRKSVQRREGDVSWDTMVQQAREAKPFELLIDPDASDFVAPIDMMDAMTSYAKATGQTAPSNHATFYRSSLESLALRYRVCLGMLEQLVENRIDTIHIVGGGSMNELLCQMTADACNRTVVAGPVEATAIGNVLMQMIGTGAFGDRDNVAGAIPAARQLVQDSFPVKTYQPQDPSSWDEPAERFLKLES